MKQQWQQYIQIIKQVVKPALGCTEPIAAAYAAAVASKELGNKTPDRIEVRVSDNLYKNSMGVYVPGTGKVGLKIASAVGALAGNPEAELEVLAKINAQDVAAAQALIDQDRVTVSRIDTQEFIYCSVTMTAGDDTVSITISGGHTNVINKTLNGEVIFEAAQDQRVATASVCEGVNISIKEIYDFAMQAEFEDIRFILQAAELNTQLAQEGIVHAYGLEIGRTLKTNIEQGLLGNDLMSRIQMMTSAASDARMGGATLPAMSNFGSGNQGIAATMPVVVAAEVLNSSEDQLARALIMSHLGAIYIKSHYPPLSAFCGNTVTSAAAAMALVYLAGGSFEQSCFAIQNVISDSSGMVCDGAKSSCAMKVCTSSTTAVRSYLMAMNNHSVQNQGIVGQEVEQTIKNVGSMVSLGMAYTDKSIIDIMSA
ncbi:L-cysteine desulfidase family protein [Vibrio sp. LaRot3]|uniref:L-cysteine desulfidase family protein n=1 Tax=Vibrio sp. LaRot3 TaxID=2998829 RepID=UPI0022CE1738|nr:L-serine ammonia-lyase, iron-sulfur-dependent, subunit alpha [Vibrio sp. LaRot3]MDA0147142.1 L-serine ammonia-lyase, iron-sulfur-dependent, subunit alpha [Vibrio sp. LaRot3]